MFTKDSELKGVQLLTESVAAHVLLDHAHIVCTQTAYACIGCRCTTYNTQYMYQRNSTLELTSVGLAHTRPNYQNTRFATLCSLSQVSYM